VILTSYAQLRAETHAKAKEIGQAMMSLVDMILRSYGLVPERVRLRVRSAKSAYYKPNSISITFMSNLNTILHEVKHHIDFIESGRQARTYKEHLERELFASAFACTEFNKWIDAYSDMVLGLQIEYTELLDKLRRG
jgi:hypothetical protein